MSKTLSQAIGESPIKSIQRGAAGAPATITISAVVMEKAILNVSVRGGYCVDGSGAASLEGGAQLTSATQITTYRGSAFGTINSSPTLYWEVIEYV